LSFSFVLNEGKNTLLQETFVVKVVIRDSLVVFFMEPSKANEFRSEKMKQKENSHK
jgi:hypothetical protein